MKNQIYELRSPDKSDRRLNDTLSPNKMDKCNSKMNMMTNVPFQFDYKGLTISPIKPDRSKKRLSRPLSGVTSSLSETIDPDDGSVKDSIIEEDTYQELKQRIRIQNNTLKEHENWLLMLLNILKVSKNEDYVKPIQRCLESIDEVLEEQTFLKLLMFCSIRENDEIKKDLEHIKFQINQHKSIIKSKELDATIKEKGNLLNSVNLLSDEISYQTDKNALLVKLSKFDKEEDRLTLLKKELEKEEKIAKNLKEKHRLLGEKEKIEKFSIANKSEETLTRSKSKLQMFSCFTSTNEGEEKATYLFNYSKK